LLRAEAELRMALLIMDYGCSRKNGFLGKLRQGPTGEIQDIFWLCDVCMCTHICAVGGRPVMLITSLIGLNVFMQAELTKHSRIPLPIGNQYLMSGGPSDHPGKMR
jgi:hypothetical protein